MRRPAVPGVGGSSGDGLTDATSNWTGACAERGVATSRMDSKAPRYRVNELPQMKLVVRDWKEKAAARLATISPISTAMIVSTTSLQIGTGLRSASRIPGTRTRKNQPNEYEMLEAAVVTMVQSSDSLMSDTATRRQNATNGANAPISRD